ncbi:hypothetical protein GGG16DRAFT_32038, partial [Schizophyllum commune]
NGANAYTLWDTGGTLDGQTPEYSRATGHKVYHLDNPVDLQLGTHGSRSRVSFGTTSTVKIGDEQISWYFDVANIDRYDAILGVPFMHAHGIVVDVARRKVFHHGKEIPVLSEGEEREIVLQQQRRRKKPTIEEFEDDTPQQVNGTPELWESDSACMSDEAFEEFIQERSSTNTPRPPPRNRRKDNNDHQPSTPPNAPPSTTGATQGSDDWLWRSRPPQPNDATPPSRWDVLRKKARKFARREQIR